jgi:formylglycine-generating enzyme required for sulfatase activity
MKTALTGMLLLGLALVSGFYWAGYERGVAVTGNSAGCAVPDSGSEHHGMVWVPGGSFTMGAEYAYREEGPAHSRDVAGFWMAQTEVTNAQFVEFITATGYLTLAERGISNPSAPQEAAVAGSAVFKPLIDDGELDPFSSWWQFIAGANWRHPEGPDSTLTGREQHPVVHIAFEDALAYADWKGHSLPTEAQFEYAAQTSARKNAAGEFTSNTWQGFFPFQNDPLDGYSGTAPVACYSANALGLHDLIGNVWEWTASPYYLGHDFAAKADYPEGYDPNQPEEAVAVIKGGSWLCAPNYCMRYRPEARQGQSKGLGTSHIGFRTVINP